MNEEQKYNAISMLLLMSKITPTECARAYKDLFLEDIVPDEFMNLLMWLTTHSGNIRIMSGSEFELIRRPVWLPR
jgi:hypothetical protein